MRSHPSQSLQRLILLASLLLACGTDTAATPPPSKPTPIDTNIPDTNVPAVPMDTAPEDTGLNIDVIIEDGFQRPELPMDTIEPDTIEPDTVEPDTVEPDTVEMDVPGADALDLDIARETGEWECLTFSLEIIGEPPFVFGQDLFLAIWDVRNICSREWRMRLEHQGDFLAIHIQKNGLPWLAYPDCFGRGEPYEIAFPFQVGLRQGWAMTPTAHQEWIDNCAAEPFDPNAEYKVIGYAHSEIAASALDYSEFVPLLELPLNLIAP